MATDNPIIFGIDPGLSGALAAIRIDGSAVGAWPLPIACREVNPALLARMFIDIRPALIVVEKVASRPGQGVASMFKFGKGYGIILGVVGALGLPYEEPTPQAWKRCVLAGTKRDKEAALAYAAKRFPSIDLARLASRKPAREGMAEALCLAEYGRRLLVGEAELDGKGVA